MNTEERKDQFAEIIGQEETKDSSRQLTSGARHDLDLAGQWAVSSKATRSHGESLGARKCEFYRVRGELGEKVALGSVPASVQADGFSRSGTNFPNYDLFSKEELSQVKVLSFDNGEPRYSAYRDAFAHLQNPDKARNATAADRLIEIKNDDPQMWNQLSSHLPQEVLESNSQYEMQNALAKSATLRIPTDQVEAVRADLANNIQAHPERYGISSLVDGAELQPQAEELVAERVLPIDERFLTSDYQEKANELIASRDLAVSQSENPEGESSDLEENRDYYYGYGH